MNFQKYSNIKYEISVFEYSNKKFEFFAINNYILIVIPLRFSKGESSR